MPLFQKPPEAEPYAEHEPEIIGEIPEPEEDLPDFDEDAEIFEGMEEEEPAPEEDEELPVLETVEEELPGEVFVSTDDYHKITAYLNQLSKVLSNSHRSLQHMTKVNEDEESMFNELYTHINDAQESLISMDKKMFEKG